MKKDKGYYGFASRREHNEYYSNPDNYAAEIPAMEAYSREAEQEHKALSDINNAKSTIADKIHEAVSSLLDTETRLNRELNEARQIARDLKSDLERLQSQFLAEQDVRRELEAKISKIAEIVR